MKIFRLLIYEGEEEILNRHLAQCYVAVDRQQGNPDSITIKEVFRGRQEDPIVEHFEEGG